MREGQNNEKTSVLCFGGLLEAVHQIIYALTHILTGKRRRRRRLWQGEEERGGERGRGREQKSREGRGEIEERRGERGEGRK
jgi:hypothetical protein